VTQRKGSKDAINKSMNDAIKERGAPPFLGTHVVNQRRAERPGDVEWAERLVCRGWSALYM